MNQLAMMGLLPSPAAHSLASGHSAWPLLVLVIVMVAVLPLARVFGKHGPGE